MQRGISIIEIMLACAVMSLVMGAIVLTHTSNAYWVLSASMHAEAASYAEAHLGELGVQAGEDFYGLVSTTTPIYTQGSCVGGGACYVVSDAVRPISACAASVATSVAWQPQGYATSSVLLSTMFTNVSAVHALGGDCLTKPLLGMWDTIHKVADASIVSGVPSSIDALKGVVYMTSAQTPYLFIYAAGSVSSYDNKFIASDPLNAVDVAYDAVHEKTYAYAAVASTTGQFMVIDVSDPAAPVEVARKSLNNVNPQGKSPQAWRVAYYDNMVYVVTRDTGGPELHIFDATDPTAPVEIGNGLNLGTSVYGLAVRDEYSSIGTKRYMYAATTLNAGELEVLDVTDPRTPLLAATLNLDDAGCTLTDKPDGTSVVLSGTLLYIGRDHSVDSCPTLPDVYAVSIANPYKPEVLASGVAGGGIIGLQASENHLFVYVSTYANPADTSLLDLDPAYLYAAQHQGNRLQVWDADPSHFVQLTSAPLTTPALQLFASL